MEAPQQSQTKKAYKPPHKRADNNDSKPSQVSNPNNSNNNNDGNRNDENQNKYDRNSKYNSKFNSKPNTNVDTYSKHNSNNNHNSTNDNYDNNDKEHEQYSSNKFEKLDAHNNNEEYNDNYDDYENYANNDNHNNNNVNDNNDQNGHNNNSSFNRNNHGSRFNNYNSRTITNNSNDNNVNTDNNNNNNNSRFHNNTSKYDNYNRNNNNSYSNYNDNNNNSRFSNYNNNRFQHSRFDDQEEDLESELFKDENHEMVQGINFAQYDRIPVEVSGHDVPAVINSFEESSLCELLLTNIKRSKYEKPTPIQKYAIPCALQGRDLMACAQTGSGKTAAFLLPIIHHLFSMEIPQRRSYFRYCAPIGVVLAPTRELAIQIHVQARKFLFESKFRSVVVYGGAEPRKQTSTLYQGCEILVATPGRLNDFLERQIITLENVKFCVLDEADRMLDMGFMPQIQSIIRDMPSKQHRNTLMFSATFPSEIQRLAQEFLNNYVFIAIGRVGSTTSFIKQKLRYATENEKLEKLIELVSSCEGLKLIFVEKKRDASMVERELIRAKFDAISIHGDRTQKEREYALQVFRTARVPILVATDVAARGLDIPNVMWVFNFDLPNNIDSYVHRIGRTGRCGNEGTAIAFVNENNKPIFKDLLKLLKETKQEIPQWFADLVYSSHSREPQFNSYNGNKKYGGGFGSRDYRTQKNFNNNGTSNDADFPKRNVYIYNGSTNDANHNDNNNSNAPSYRRELAHNNNSKMAEITTQQQNWQNDSW